MCHLLSDLKAIMKGFATNPHNSAWQQQTYNPSGTEVIIQDQLIECFTQILGKAFLGHVTQL